MRLLSALLVACILCFSCQSKPSEEEKLLKAAHNKQKQAISMIAELEQALENDANQAQDSLRHAIHELEESLFEIPGYHLELPGHEGHDHSHSKIELSNQEIYDVQVDLLEQLNEIKKIVENK